MHIGSLELARELCSVSGFLSHLFDIEIIYVSLLLWPPGNSDKMCSSVAVTGKPAARVTVFQCIPLLLTFYLNLDFPLFLFWHSLNISCFAQYFLINCINC